MRYVVHKDKIAKYLLDLSSRVGAPKAQFFLSKGFAAARPDEFAAALKRHPREATLRSVEPHPEGRVLRYECAITAPDGSRICIRSIWIQTANRRTTRLITAYPFL